MDIITIVLFVVGLGLLVVGAELLVRGASQLAFIMGITPLVVGLTVVAYGTSAPELAVSVQSSYAGQADIAVGNVVGSNIFNVLFILGLSALIMPLRVSSQLTRFDVPVMIGASVALLLLALDGVVGRIDGVLLTLGALVYTIWLIRQSRKETQQQHQQETSPPANHSLSSIVAHIALVLGGLALLVLGARWLVSGAMMFARHLGVSELIIGLTIVAVGTSLPELATSVIASFRKQGDIAVGNVVGSNIFNILAVLGISSMVSPTGIVVPHTALVFDIPVMIGVAVACLPIFFTGQLIARWEGGVFFFYYVAYTTYLILRDTNNSWLPLLHTSLLFLVPLTIITLFILAGHALRAKHQTA